jgi:ferredoxin
MSSTARFVRGRQPKDKLWLSLDRKVSPLGWWQESRRRWVPKVPNSFGLPAGISCPGATDFCVSCYGVNAERGSGVLELLQHNLELLKEARTAQAMAKLLVEMVASYKNEADRIALPLEQRIFRIHWDGDFYSADYATAWSMTVRLFPEIRFFAYTRSFRPPVNVVPILAGIPNLALYLSVDEENTDEAYARLAEGYDVKLALCAEDYRSARQLARDRKSRICPENAERIPLMDENGGACVQCGICVRGSSDIIFSTSHLEDVDKGQLGLWEGVTLKSLRIKPVYRATVRYCRYRRCGGVLEPSTVQRRAEFCNKTCRWAEYRLRKRERELHEPVQPELGSELVLVGECGRAQSDWVEVKMAVKPPEAGAGSKDRLQLTTDGACAADTQPGGSSPTRSRRRYRDDELLEHLRVVTRHYGRRPTDIELTNYRRENGHGPTAAAYQHPPLHSVARARELAGVNEILVNLESK